MEWGQVHTIPYSQFKQFVAERRVKDCVLTSDEVYGDIVAQPLPLPAQCRETARRRRPSRPRLRPASSPRQGQRSPRAGSQARREAGGIEAG